MEKLTDNEIIKALECCNSEDVGSCNDCPLAYDNDDLENCDKRVRKEAIALINRQKAEIEGAKLRYEEIKADRDKEHQYAMHYARMCAKAKFEAIKEFAEKLKKIYKGADGLYGVIDNIIKEMME